VSHPEFAALLQTYDNVLALGTLSIDPVAANAMGAAEAVLASLQEGETPTDIAEPLQEILGSPSLQVRFRCCSNALLAPLPTNRACISWSSRLKRNCFLCECVTATMLLSMTGISEGMRKCCRIYVTSSRLKVPYALRNGHFLQHGPACH